ncbi:MAG: hypothetical protein QOF88_6670, partial [Mycobacterium sp.]|nr:hypothetical protein [Mycobacterium sp.]
MKSRFRCDSRSLSGPRTCGAVLLFSFEMAEHSCLTPNSTRASDYTSAMFSETRYALNGDLRVAYRASREGPRDLVFVPNLLIRRYCEFCVGAIGSVSETCAYSLFTDGVRRQDGLCGL